MRDSHKNHKLVTDLARVGNVRDEKHGVKITRV